MSEKMIQALLMRRNMMRKKHRVCVPNSQYLLHWESDLLSVTKAGLVHDYEIKCSRSDYMADFRNKKFRHHALEVRMAGKVPNYFWFVTYEFEIEPPEYAGWILVHPRKHESVYGDTHWLTVKKNAPRLHGRKWGDEQVAKAGHLLAFRVMNFLETEVKRHNGSSAKA